MKIGLVAVVVVVVLAVGGFVLANHKSNKPSSSNSSSTSSSKSSTPPLNTSADRANNVTISNFAFTPADITIKKGMSVTWTNKDSVAHTVTETDGKDGPKSGDLNQGKTYTFTYNSVGTFKYNCTIHSNMVGFVTVTK